MAKTTITVKMNVAEVQARLDALREKLDDEVFARLIAERWKELRKSRPSAADQLTENHRLIFGPLDIEDIERRVEELADE